jgi:hypothetical protein
MIMRDDGLSDKGTWAVAGTAPHLLPRVTSFFSVEKDRHKNRLEAEV